MTRTELMIYAKQEYDKALARHTYKEYSCLNQCQACYVDTGTAVILKSYDTIVAIFNKQVGSLYVFNYYSATTVRHICKFASMLEWDRIVYLYKRSDSVIEKFYNAYGQVKERKIGKNYWDTLLDCDFTVYVTNRWD